MKLNINRAILLAFSLILVASAFKPQYFWVSTKPGNLAGDTPQDQLEDLSLEPTHTSFVNLPIIEENSSHDLLDVGGAVVVIAQSTPVETPTPTPIPPQSGSVNIPIVLGALAIILVVTLAWFFFNFLPGRRSE